MSKRSMGYKLVATDVDGTITNENREVDIDVLYYIRRIREFVPIVITTGNNLCVAEIIATLIGASKDYIIAENGGVLKVKDKIIKLGNREKAIEVFKKLKQKYNLVEVNMSNCRLTDVAIKRTIDSKILEKEILNYDVKIFDTKFAIHIVDKNVDKSIALKRLSEHLNIKLDEIIAIGDSENDRKMLEVAGYSICIGYELKDVADICFERRSDAFKHVLNIILKGR